MSKTKCKKRYCSDTPKGNGFRCKVVLHSPEWFFKWTVRLPFCVNRLKHSGHSYGCVVSSLLTYEHK